MAIYSQDVTCTKGHSIILSFDWDLQRTEGLKDCSKARPVSGCGGQVAGRLPIVDGLGHPRAESRAEVIRGPDRLHVMVCAAQGERRGQVVEMVRLEQAIRCATCGQVTLFEFDVPTVGAMSSSFDCPNGHSALNPAGGVEVVDLKDYDKSELAKVVL